MDNLIKILLVEDEFIASLHMKKQLEKMNYEVTKIVSTGENAIISARQNPPDIILMDIRLAGEMDGIEAASVIKGESQSDIPVIFVTGYNDDEIQKRADMVRPLEYLIKPVQMNKLKNIIDGYFKY